MHASRRSREEELEVPDRKISCWSEYSHFGFQPKLILPNFLPTYLATLDDFFFTSFRFLWWILGAFLDTDGVVMMVVQCKLGNDRNYTSAGTGPHSTEFIAALAAGIGAELIVEVSSCASPSTIALAVAARQTGGRLICILSKSEALLDAMVAMKELGLSRVVEFIIGDAEDILPQYSDVDFALIDCRRDQYVELFEILRFNPNRAVVVADNLYDRKATAAYSKIIKNRPGARSITLPIGKGIEVTRLSRAEEENKSSRGRRSAKKVSWAMDIDNMSSQDFLQC